MNKYDTIIFDFDYTLADSSKGVWQSINYALKQLCFEEVMEEKTNLTIGLSLEETFWSLVGKQDEEITNKFCVLFVEKADKVMADLTRIFPDVLEAIPKISGLGYKLGIVSTKFRYRIHSILSREKLLKYFDIIVGGEDVTKQKPNPEGIEKAINVLETSPDKVLYIGDSLTDEKTAGNVKVDFCAILTGVTEKQHFNDKKVIKYFYSMKELYEGLRG